MMKNSIYRRGALLLAGACLLQFASCAASLVPTALGIVESTLTTAFFSNLLGALP